MTSTTRSQNNCTTTPKPLHHHLQSKIEDLVMKKKSTMQHLGQDKRMIKQLVPLCGQALLKNLRQLKYRKILLSFSNSKTNKITLTINSMQLSILCSINKRISMGLSVGVWIGRTTTKNRKMREVRRRCISKDKCNMLLVMKISMRMR